MENNSRRDFLKFGSLLAIGFSLPSLGGGIHKMEVANAALGLELSPYIVIDDLGKIIIYNAKPDVGQGTWQAIPMLLAEELEVSMEQIEIRMTDGTAKFGFRFAPSRPPIPPPKASELLAKFPDQRRVWHYR